MRFDWLESFLAFAETQNFTRAAERLHISQPALHVQIKRLGESLGVPLYRREGRSLELTDQGLALEAFARDMAQRNTAFVNRLRAGGADAPVVLAAGRGTHLYMIAATIRRWVQNQRTLSLLSGDQGFIVRSVLSGRAHIGIAPLDLQSDELESTLVRAVGQAAVVGVGHPLATKRRLRLTQLADHPLILPPADRPHRIAVSRAFQSIGRRIDLGVEAGGWELMMHYASLGLGIAIVNDYCTPPRDTVMIPIPDLPTLDYFAFVRANGFLPTRAAELVAELGASRRKRGR